MTNKPVAYMLVAILVGVTLITAVPDQIARYATPQRMLSVNSGDTDLLFTPKVGEGVIIKYRDPTNSSGVNLTGSDEIWFEVVNSTHVEIGNGTVVVTGMGFSGDGVYDINEQVEDLANQLDNVSDELAVVEDSIADVSALAGDAVEAANSAADAVTAVASTANTASLAAANAAEAANAARSSASGLSTINMFVWYAVDALIAVGVYILAKRRFS